MRVPEPKRIFVHREARCAPLVERVCARFPQAPVEVVDCVDAVVQEIRVCAEDPIGEGKRWWYLSRFPGGFLKRCPGSKGQICCNYWVLNSITNCPFDCSYCVLQEYLGDNPLLRIFVNTDDMVKEVARRAVGSSGAPARIGTGELGDSLALDPITDLSRELVPLFSIRGDAFLELKTKSANVRHLAGLDHGGRTVISWSLSPPRLVSSDELGTAPLEERIAAAAECQRYGYPLALHFDPIVLYPGWADEYGDVLGRVFSEILPERVAWVSLGALRFTPRLKDIMRERFPQSLLTLGEHVLGRDGKLRYPRSARVEAYRLMLRRLRRYGHRIPVYLCMESQRVWHGVFGHVPLDDPLARFLFLPARIAD